MTIKVTQSHLEKIQTYLESCYPEEGCCILMGGFENNIKILKEIIPVRNASKKKRIHYSIDPLEYSKVEKECKERCLKIIGVAHSHPENPAIPSDYDKQNSWPFFSYIIISVKSGKSDSVKSWILKDDRSGVEEEQIVAH